MGHAAGDRMLKAAGSRLRHVVREGDTVARLGGDEFTVVLEDVAGNLEAERIAQKVIARVRSAARARQRTGSRHLAVDRHQLLSRSRPGADRSAEVRRHRDVPGEGARPATRTWSTPRRWMRRRGCAQRPSRPCARRLERNEFSPRLPAQAVAARRAHHRRRGAAALAQRRPRQRAAGVVHPDRRRNRPDHRDRRLGREPGLRAARALARRGRARRDDVGQRFGAATVARRADAAPVRHPRRARHRAEPARARAHRKHGHGERRAIDHDAASAQGGRRHARDRRLRHRLFVAESI